MVLKKGVNTPHGNVRTYFENQSSSRSHLASLAEALGNTTGKGNRTDRYFDRGSISAAAPQGSRVGLGHHGADQHQAADADGRPGRNDLQELTR